MTTGENDVVAVNACAKYPMSDAVAEDLRRRFSYHAPHGDQIQRYTEFRDLAHHVAAQIVFCCPPSREQSLALTKLEEAVMWANAAIARNESEKN